MADHAPDHAPNPVDLYVGARIRARRRGLNISQETLAGALGLTFQQVQKYERGANRVSASKLHAIAEALEAEPGWFFDGLPRAGERRTVEARTAFDLATAPGGHELGQLYLALPDAARKGLLNVAFAMGAALGGGALTGGVR